MFSGHSRVKRVVLLTAIMAVGLLLVFTGCSKKTLTNFMEGTTINGIDVSGKTLDEAQEILKNSINDYSIEITLDGVKFTMTGAQLGLTYSDKFDIREILLLEEENGDKNGLSFRADVFSVKDEKKTEEAMVAAYTASLAEKAAENKADTSAVEETNEEKPTDSNTSGLTDPTAAHIAYDAAVGAFVGVDGEPGEFTDYSEATKNLIEAAEKLETKATLKSKQGYSEGEKAKDSTEVKNALTSANAYLDIELTYSFTPSGGSTSYETVSKDTIASWLAVQADGLTVDIDTNSVSAYCAELSEKYSTSSSTSQFKTHYGSYISVRVPSAGQTVDTDKLYDDLYSCVKNKTSGSRTAPYSTASNSSGIVDFGGNYVEVDLDAQQVYVHKNYQLVVSSGCVSGSVADGYRTPTGVYTIKYKETDTYLVGATYRSWVNFWVPFNGGIGFHDASWRSSFGGSYYLYSGSHGCINMPYSAAKSLYNNVSAGTYVVVYGGATSVSGRSQVWTGTDSYTVKVGSGPFKLDMTAKDDAKLIYSSDNNSVATVSEDGTVTPVGVGTCTVTVRSEATTGYVSSYKNITITVEAVKQDQTVTGTSGYSVTVGDNFRLDAVSSGGTQLSYSSSNSSVAIVDGNGNVSAVGAGYCTITVAAAAQGNYNSASMTVTITVSAPAKMDQSFSGTTSYTKNVGDADFVLDITALGGAGLSYSTSDSTVCSVSTEGHVSIVGQGTCTITVLSAETGEYNAGSISVTITVNP